MKKIIIIILFFISSIHAIAGNDPVILMNEGKLYEAALLFEKQAFESSNNYDRSVALLNKSYCLKGLGYPDVSVYTLSRINYPGLPDSLIRLLRNESAIDGYLSGEFEFAESNILQYPGDNSVLYPLYALVLNEMREWKKADSVIDLYMSAHPQQEALKVKIDSLYSKAPKLKRLDRALVLSSFLPGVGQMYAGYWKEGIINAALCAGSVAIGAYAVYMKLYFSAFVGGYGLLQKFYLGGQNHLEYLVDQRNKILSYGYNQGLKEEILKLK